SIWSVVLFLLFACNLHPRYLHSFPTRRSSDLLNSTKEIHILILEPVFLLVFLVCDLLVLIFTKFDDIVKILEGIVHPLDKQVGMLHYFYSGITHYFPDQVLMFL